MFPTFLPTLALAALAAAQSTPSLLQYIDLRIGTAGGGNSFPGSTRPFGAVRAGPDTISSSSATAGWTSTGKLTGISMMHESGTGGTPKYGVISQMPITGNLSAVNIGDNRTYAQTRSTETFAPVHYSTHLASGVSINATTAHHSAILYYDFPAGDAHVLVDVAHHLPTLSGELQFPETYMGGEVNIGPNGTYWGNGSYAGSWNRSPKWTIFFCASFNPPPTSASTFTYAYDFNKPPAASPPLSNVTTQSGSSATVPGALFTWTALDGTAARTVESRLGVSWISPQRACQFVQEEIPWASSFASVVADGQKEWDEQIFQSITVPADPDGAAPNATLLTMLYTSLYYAGILPSNRTGENPNLAYPTAVPYYDDFYTLWDTFRCWTPLQHLFQTSRYVDIVRSLIGIWKTDGFLPDGRSSNFNGREQGGSNADVVIADAFVKGLNQHPTINWTDGWQSLWTDGNVVPPNPNPDPDSPKDSTAQGRGALPDWVQYGYITRNYTRSVSRTVEYSLNDFSLYQVARGLGLQDQAPTYLNRSANWQNLWNPNLTASGFSGFLSPRTSDGTFDTTRYSVTSCSGACYWGDDTYEASPWEYSFSMPHDIARVIELSGGPSQFVARLDATFANQFNNVGNEPSFMTPFLYNYVSGMQYKSVAEVRSIVNKYYNAGASGIPGNGDAGAMQSYLVWMLIGMYPVTGQPTYLLTSPFLPAVDLRLFTSSNGTGVSSTPNTLSIRATNLSATSFYVQNVALNGVALNRSFVEFDEIADGGLLEFVLGPNPVAWDVGPLPPSVSTGGFS
ncbi:glycosyl hydrolase family 92-domain-containing protein [Gloeopeniophorella convolvens]|nr:glycosyl hydrolase family 92-domain-containing protein [Gloeopeniophorella convolvens]